MCLLWVGWKQLIATVTTDWSLCGLSRHQCCNELEATNLCLSGRPLCCVDLKLFLGWRKEKAVLECTARTGLVSLASWAVLNLYLGCSFCLPWFQYWFVVFKEPSSAVWHREFKSSALDFMHCVFLEGFSPPFHVLILVHIEWWTMCSSKDTQT